MNNPRRSKPHRQNAEQPKAGARSRPSGAKKSSSSASAKKNSSSSESLQYVVRFGAMRTLGVMDAKTSFGYQDEVVVRSKRGTELGTVLCEATPAAVGAIAEPTHGQILRSVSQQDRDQRKYLDSLSSTEAAICQRLIDQNQLDMELVEIERILGGEKMVVYFLAENRVDFRQLVRDLAKQFKTKVEMRHIGARDEAKLLADYGDCGQPICCATFLSKMPPVSMKMAKIQKATLDPAKISGRCGRLKCCLRYEFETYQAMAEEMPSVGSLVLTRDGNVTVLGHNLLANQLVVRTDDNRRILIHADDVVRVVPS